MLRAYPAPTSTGLSKELVTPVRSRARSCGNGRLDPESSLGDVYLKRVYLCIHTYTSYIHILLAGACLASYQPSRSMASPSNRPPKSHPPTTTQCFLAELAMCCARRRRARACLAQGCAEQALVREAARLARLP